MVNTKFKSKSCGINGEADYIIFLLLAKLTQVRLRENNGTEEEKDSDAGVFYTDIDVVIAKHREFRVML